MSQVLLTLRWGTRTLAELILIRGGCFCSHSLALSLLYIELFPHRTDGGGEGGFLVIPLLFHLSSTFGVCVCVCMRLALPRRRGLSYTAYRARRLSHSRCISRTKVAEEEEKNKKIKNKTTTTGIERESRGGMRSYGPRMGLHMLLYARSGSQCVCMAPALEISIFVFNIYKKKIILLCNRNKNARKVKSFLII